MQGRGFQDEKKNEKDGERDRERNVIALYDIFYRLQRFLDKLLLYQFVIAHEF